MLVPDFSLDATRRETRAQREAFERVRRAANYYGVQLRKIAKHVDDIVRGFDHPLAPQQEDELQFALQRYAELLRPWARSVGQRMVMEVARRDEKAWATYTRNMSTALRQEIRDTPIGDALRAFLDSQVSLITSLPLDAARRVHDLTVKSRSTGARIPELVSEIMRTGQVTKSRATLIARTETARTASGLTMVRAKSIGSEGYIWRTVRDEDVRTRHRKLEGKFIKWDNPPVAGENGERAHAGMIYNCFPGNVSALPIDKCLRVFRTRYCGPLVQLKTAKSFLETTPNHPMLSSVGLRAAHMIKVGDDLVQVGSNSFFEDNVDKRPVAFEEIFEFLSAFRETGAPGSVFDFYGDPTYGEVEIIRPERHLILDAPDVAFNESRNDVLVTTTNGRMTNTILRGHAQVDQALLTGSLNERSSLTDVGLSSPVAFADRSNGDAVLLQNASDGRGGGAKLHRQRTGSDASRVQLYDFSGGQVGSCACPTTKVVRISSRWFDGHVYTMQCSSGFYAVGDEQVIVGNCRCFPEPVIPERF